MAVAVVGGLTALAACSGKGRPPYIDEGDPHSGNVVANGGATTNPDLSASGAPATGASGSGATGSTGGDNLAALDPDKVYMIGTLATAQRTFNLGLADVLDARTYTLGVPTDGSPYVMHGTLLYATVGDGFRELVPEYSGSDPPDDVPYPEDPQANDRKVAAPCPDGEPAVNYVAGPEAQLVYFCHDTIWYQEGRKLGPISLAFQALGYGDLALLWGGSHDFTIMNLADLEPRLVMERDPLKAKAPLTARARNNGFIYVMEGEALDTFELHETDVEGNVTVVGAYPALPAGTVTSPFHGAKLDGQGNLFVAVRWLDTTKREELLVAKLELSGASTLVYQSVTDKAHVLLHQVPNMHGLFTGP
jgi:hypothetical protein